MKKKERKRERQADLSLLAKDRLLSYNSGTAIRIHRQSEKLGQELWGQEPTKTKCGKKNL